MSIPLSGRDGLVAVSGHVWQMRDTLRMWHGEALPTRLWIRRDRVDAMAKAASDLGEAVRNLEIPDEGAPLRGRYDTLVTLGHDALIGAYAMRNGCDRDPALLSSGLERYENAVTGLDAVLAGWAAEVESAGSGAGVRRTLGEDPTVDWEPYGFGE